MLLSAALGTSDRDHAFNLAMGIEFIHTATLVHDDLIDNARTRRGITTIHETVGVNPAIIIGDYYFAKGANLLALIGEPSIDLAISNTVMTICLGELLQLTSHRDYDQTVEEYHRKIARKTAALVETCCYCGAVVGHLDEAHTEALRQYGFLIGMAFQIADDVLDYTATADELGKPVGADLRQGTVTLPLMLALREPSVAPQLRAVLAHEELSDADAETVVQPGARVRRHREDRGSRRTISPSARARSWRSSSRQPRAPRSSRCATTWSTGAPERPLRRAHPCAPAGRETCPPTVPAPQSPPPARTPRPGWRPASRAPAVAGQRRRRRTAPRAAASTSDTTQRTTRPARTTVYSRTRPARSWPARVSSSSGVRPAGGSGAPRRSRSRATAKKAAAAQPSQAVTGVEPVGEQRRQASGAARGREVVLHGSDHAPSATAAAGREPSGGHPQRCREAAAASSRSAATCTRPTLPWPAIVWHCRCDLR